MPPEMFRDEKMPEKVAHKIISLATISLMASQIDRYVLPGLQSNDSQMTAASLDICRALLAPGGGEYKAVMPTPGGFAGVIEPLGALRETIAKALEGQGNEPDEQSRTVPMAPEV